MNSKGDKRRWKAMFAGLAFAVAADAAEMTAHLNANGQVEVRFTAGLGLYYVLMRGETVGAMQTPVGMAWQNFGIIIDPTPVAEARAAFYRLREIPVSMPYDHDGDFMDDVYELVRHDPLDPTDAFKDADGDNIANVLEYRDLHPTYHPSILDNDYDGLTNGEESRAGTDPFNLDTDGDRWCDFSEVGMGSDPRSAESIPRLGAVAVGLIDAVVPVLEARTGGGTVAGALPVDAVVPVLEAAASFATVVDGAQISVVAPVLEAAEASGTVVNRVGIDVVAPVLEGGRAGTAATPGAIDVIAPALDDAFGAVVTRRKIEVKTP